MPSPPSEHTNLRLQKEASSNHAAPSRQWPHGSPFRAARSTPRANLQARSPAGAPALSAAGQPPAVQHPLQAQASWRSATILK